MAGASTLYPPFLAVRRAARGCSAGRSRMFGGPLGDVRRAATSPQPTHPQAGCAAPSYRGRVTNALAHATSPYLRQHADNPVDWHEWGPDAFAEARRRDVPILLSVGYAACHWCHVMADESFSDEQVAAVMNAQFVPVKVDREERPDVDALYMQATQAMTGQGGWPMTAFLTPA